MGAAAHAAVNVGTGLGRLRLRNVDWAAHGAGLLCLSVYVSTPTFLASGPLVHTDLAVTLFSLLALCTFAKVWQ